MTVTYHSQFDLARAYARRTGVELCAPHWLLDRRIDELALARATRARAASQRRRSSVTYHSQFDLARLYARRAGVELGAPRWLLDRRIDELAFARTTRARAHPDGGEAEQAVH